MWIKCGNNRINVKKLDEYYVIDEKLILIDRDKKKRTINFDTSSDATEAAHEIDVLLPVLDFYEYLSGKNFNEIFS